MTCSKGPKLRLPVRSALESPDPPIIRLFVFIAACHSLIQTLTIVNRITTKSSRVARMDAPNTSQMQDKLDELWEKHLDLLDQYDAAQKQLQKLMSSVSHD